MASVSVHDHVFIIVGYRLLFLLVAHEVLTHT